MTVQNSSASRSAVPVHYRTVPYSPYGKQYPLPPVPYDTVPFRTVPYRTCTDTVPYGTDAHVRYGTCTAEASAVRSDSLAALFQGTLDEPPCIPANNPYQPQSQPSSTLETVDHEAARLYQQDTKERKRQDNSSLTSNAARKRQWRPWRPRKLVMWHTLIKPPRLPCMRRLNKRDLGKRQPRPRS